MISIVIPLYDKADQVKETLESVRLQTFTAYEVIIVDDGSTDGSLDIVGHYLREWGDFSRKVRLFSQPNRGVSAARNKGIQESLFDWIAFLDADDTWLPEYLQYQYELSLKYPFCEVLAAAYTVRYNAGKIVPVKSSRLPFDHEDGVLDNYFEVAACSYPPLSSLVTIVRKSAMQAVGGFPEGISTGEDLLTWARLAVNCKIAYNKKRLALYDRDVSRRNHDQRSRMPAREDRVGGYLEDLFRRHMDIRGLKQYVGAWYKMRTRIYLSHSMRREALMEWRKLVRFSPVNYKTWLYLILLISPVKILQ
ncbi:MAG: glycosyltransferase family 2 protein [Chitinophagaceae bacterium]|nr:glycosyltransferase family 2 protein [Chitinophagaceae bacterium]